MSILNASGQLIDNIILPGCPEISCMFFSKNQNCTMYYADNSQTMYKVYVTTEEKKDKDKN